MNRRDLLALLAGASLSRDAGAQPTGRTRRIAILMEFAETDPRAQALLAAFREGLAESGLAEGQNLHIDLRFAEGLPERMRAFAAELVQLGPEVILASGTPVTVVLQKTTQSVPIVFVQVADPVGNGIVHSLKRPGGNVTGFANFEPAMVGKWLELLKEVAPGVARALLIQNPENPTWPSYLQIAAEVGPALAVQPVPRGVHDAAEIKRAVAEFAQEPHGGLVVLPDATTTVANRALILGLAQLHHLPAVYPFRYLANQGGLVGYGPDPLDIFRRGAGYVDRILKGANPADLPVQQPTKFELVINLKTAKALGLVVPQSLLARADEVIE